MVLAQQLLVRVVAQNLEGGRVAEADPPFGINAVNPFTRCIQDMTHLLLAVGHLLEHRL